jgi:acyl-CoA oxidase
MGLNGVDNGQIWFDSVRVPRDAMLDRYASVDAAGTYSSPIPTVSARFGTMVGGLTTGRILIGQGAVSLLSLCIWGPCCNSLCCKWRGQLLSSFSTR